MTFKSTGFENLKLLEMFISYAAFIISYVILIFEGACLCYGEFEVSYRNLYVAHQRSEIIKI